jgi:predicted TIM-barrel fold metal-dependent hydrolase
LEDKTWRENFKLLHKYSLTFDLQIYPEQVDQAYELMRTHSNVNAVIEHILQPSTHDPISIKHWEKKLAKLATLPNIFIKLSGMNLFVHTFHFETLKTLFETVVHYFSPYRCMIGSNFPVEKLYVSFDKLFASLLKITQQYSQEEQKALFYETAKKFYRI